MEFKSTDLPIENEYPKLVRDRIPEKIKKDSKTVKVETITTDDEYLKFMFKKMVEESLELQHSLEHGNMQEELADIFELIYAILKLKGWMIEDIIAVQKEKREKNGGFDKRLLLLSKPESNSRE